MTENQKDSVKKSFWQRNLFLLIVLFIIVAGGGGYLYQNNILTFQTTKQSNKLTNSQTIFSKFKNIEHLIKHYL